MLHSKMFALKNIVFGLKNSFAIEIEFDENNKSKSKLRLWANKEEIGDFRIKNRIIYAIDTFKKLYHIENYSNSFFDNKAATEIFSECLLLNKNFDDWTKEDVEIFQNFSNYSPFFGDQLDNVTYIIYLKDDYVNILWSYNNDYSGKKINYLTNLKSTKVEYYDFVNTVIEFLLFYDVKI